MCTPLLPPEKEVRLATLVRGLKERKEEVEREAVALTQEKKRFEDETKERWALATAQHTRYAALPSLLPLLSEPRECALPGVQEGALREGGGATSGELGGRHMLKERRNPRAETKAQHTKQQMQQRALLHVFLPDSTTEGVQRAT